MDNQEQRSSSPASLHGFDERVFNQLAESMGGNDGLISNVVSRFLRDVPEQIAHLQRAINEQDIATIYRITHNLKSNSAILGAWHLAALCREMSDATQAGNLQGATEQVRQIAWAFDRVRFILQRKLVLPP